MKVVIVIYGKLVSMKNQRRIVQIGDVSRLIKSKEALAFEENMLRQIPPKARVRLTGMVSVSARVFYESRRADLDMSLVLDCLQDRWAPAKGSMPRTLIQHGVYQNDNQVDEQHFYRFIDQTNPRVEIVVAALEPQQTDLA